MYPTAPQRMGRRVLLSGYSKRRRNIWVSLVDDALTGLGRKIYWRYAHRSENEKWATQQRRARKPQWIGWLVYVIQIRRFLYHEMYRKAWIISYASTLLECLENAKNLAKNNELIILATTRLSSSIHLNLTPAHHPSSSIDLFHRLFNEPSVLRIEHLLRPVSASTFVINFSPSDDQPLLV